MPAKTRGSPAGFVVSAFTKLRSGGDVTLTKEELLSLLLVVKVGAALAVGVAAGVLPLQGYAGFIAFVGAGTILPFLTYRSVLQVDEEEYGGHQMLVMEDLNIALPLFLLTWILTYSSLWF